MSTSPVLAHGVGTRADLPIPLELALFGGAAAVIVSFGALGLLWTRSRLRGEEAGRPLPRWLAAVVDNPVVVWVLRLLGRTVTGVGDRRSFAAESIEHTLERVRAAAESDAGRV